MRVICAFIFLLFSNLLIAQSVSEVYPSHWWVGMKNPQLQLLVYGKGIGTTKQVRFSYAGVKLQRIHRFANQNYLALDLIIAERTKPGNINIEFEGEQTTSIEYALHQRREGKGQSFAKGISSADLIYLIMPDRFCQRRSQQRSLCQHERYCVRSQSRRPAPRRRSQRHSA
ncbi:MAG: cyclomaltodextrinase N-terminal domain-containing protein, partial [Chitinophagaceae bacterium]